MTAKFNLHTNEGIANFNSFVENAIREDLCYILQGNPEATGVDVADYIYANADNHDQGPRGYWSLGDNYERLTNDTTTERLTFVNIGNRMLRELAYEAMEARLRYAHDPLTLATASEDHLMRNTSEAHLLSLIERTKEELVAERIENGTLL